MTRGEWSFVVMAFILAPSVTAGGAALLLHDDPRGYVLFLYGVIGLILATWNMADFLSGEWERW